jgi:hypothetical protein
MRIAIHSVLLAALFAGAACEKSTTRGPGDKQLQLVKPADQTLRRGETDEVALTIVRENFSGPVSVKFEGLPAGVDVVENKPIAADETRAVYNLHAANDASLVEGAQVRVTVEGPDMMRTTQTFQVSVKDK